VLWQYGYVRRYALRILHVYGLAQLMVSSMAHTLPGLREVARAAVRRLAGPGAPLLVNDYDVPATTAVDLVPVAGDP
jgi:hypothetical protein